MAASSMAFRVAQLQGLAHTETAPCSPPSLLYESPSNHKVSAASAKEEAEPPGNDSPSTTENIEDTASKVPTNSARANANSAEQIPSSTADLSSVAGTPVPTTKISGHRVARSSSTSKVFLRKRAAYSMPSYIKAETEGFTPCPASDADSEMKIDKQRFLNIFEDETSAETGSAVDATSPVRRPHPPDVAAPADEESALGSEDKYSSRRSGCRRGTHDSSRLRAGYCRPDHRSAKVNGESSSDYTTDALRVNPSRSVKMSPEYCPISVVPLHCTPRNHVNSDEEKCEQHRLAFSPRRHHLPLSRQKERHHYRGDARSARLAHTREKASISALTVSAAGSAASRNIERCAPAASACASAAAIPGVTSAAAPAPAGPSPAAFSNHYHRECLSEGTDDCDVDEMVEWKGWREVLLERQRAMERHMHAQRRHINRKEKEQQRAANKGRRGVHHARGARGVYTHDSDVHTSTESHTEDEVSSQEEDPLGITPKPTTKSSRPPERLPAAAATARAPASPQQQYAATPPPAVASANSFATARCSAPPLPAGPPFFGSSLSPAFYPSWPPSFYAAAVAAAAAARRAGEEAGMTGQERIQDLKKALERAECELKDKEEEARNQLEEEKKKHEGEREELTKQLAQLRETLEEREKEVTVATAKHAEAEKQKKVLREEFDIITRVHKDMKGEFQREKDTLLAEKAGLQAKVEELEKQIEFSKDQLLVARESLVAARAKQLTATQAHEQDLKTLQEYRLEIETLREDLKYLQILNLSLTEKVQRFSTSPQLQPLPHAPGAATAAEAAAATARGGGRRRSAIVAADGMAAGIQQQQQGAGQSTKSGNNSNHSTHKLPPQARTTLQELLSPQLQQKLLRDRQNECRGSAACSPPVKEATFTLPSSLESHGEPSAACSPAAATCNGGAGGGRGEGGVKRFARAAAFAPPATPGGAAPAERAAGEPPEEKENVDYCDHQLTSRPRRHCLPSPFEGEEESSAAVAAYMLDSAGARLRTASPASPSFRKEANVFAAPLRSMAATAFRCRSVPSSSAFSSLPSRGRDMHTPKLTTGSESKEELRLARLCATVLAAQSQREQERKSRTAAVAAEARPCPAGALPSSSSRVPLCLFPSPHLPRAALLQPHSIDAAEAEQQQFLQRYQKHESASSGAPHTQATVPPTADMPAADLSSNGVSFACGKRKDCGIWSQPFDRRSSERTQQHRGSSASLFNRERTGVSHSSTREERRLVSDASCLYMDKPRISPSSYAGEAEQPGWCTGDGQRLMSDPLFVNVAESDVSRCSYRQGEQPAGTHSYAHEEKLPTSDLHANNKMPLKFDSSFAQGEPNSASFTYPKKHRVSNVTRRSGQQQLLSNGSSTAGDSALLPSFHSGEECVAAFVTGAVGGSTAAGGAESPCSHHTDTTGNPTDYHMQIPCGSRISHAFNVGEAIKAEEAEENKVNARSSSNRDEGHEQAEKQDAAGQGSSNCKTEGNAQRSHHSAEEHAMRSASLHSKQGYIDGSNKEGNACTSSSSRIGINRQEVRTRGRISVPGLALNDVPPSFSCATADRSRNACGNSILCSGPNSARTQWLLNRVARISRLQGLQNIQEKLKDLPPALLAASDSARRSSQKRETVKASGSTSSSISSTGSGERRSISDRGSSNMESSGNSSSTGQHNGMQQ